MTNDDPSTAEELLYGPYQKLQRARHHITDLDERIDAFFSERKLELWIQLRRNPGQLALRVKGDKSVPPEFSLIIGDAFHNLRSALDLAMYRMAGHRAKRPNRVQFPFPKDASEKAYKSAFQDGQVEFAGKRVVEAIRLLKPDPKGNPRLSAIHAIDASDKHRLLLVAVSVAQFITGTQEAEFITRLWGDILNLPPGVSITLAASQNDDFLAVDLAGHDIPDLENKAAFQPTFTLSLGKNYPLAHQPIVKALVDCEIEVRRVVDALVEAYMAPNNTFPT